MVPNMSKLPCGHRDLDTITRQNIWNKYWPLIYTLVSLEWLLWLWQLSSFKFSYSSKPWNPPNLRNSPKPEATNFRGVVFVHLKKIGSIVYNERSSYSRAFKWYIAHPIWWRIFLTINIQNFGLFVDVEFIIFFVISNVNFFGIQYLLGTSL